MKKITLNNGKYMLEDQIETTIEGIVKPIGNGAMTLIPKKHIGKKVYILIVRE